MQVSPERIRTSGSVPTSPQSLPFTGNNTTLTSFGYAFGPIQGSLEGTLTLQ